MAANSGVGRYIREVGPRVRRLLPEVKWRWVGFAEEAWMQLDPMTEFTRWASPIYSWREHFSTPPSLANADLRWVPHYNVTSGGSARLLATIHDILPMRYRSGLRGKIRGVLFENYLRRVKQTAEAVLCNSAFTRQELIDAGGLLPERLHVTPLGCTPPVEFSPVRSSASRAPFFLFVGNTKPHKNLLRLMSAWSHVSNRMPERLVLVGQRDGFFIGHRKVEQMARALGDRIEFTGMIGDGQLWSLMKQATALIQPSEYEGFGLPVLEAMAAGCPVLASHAAALPEVAGDAAIYFAPHDVEELARKLELLSNDEPLREGLRQRGLARSRSWSWDRTAKLTAEIIDRLLTGKIPADKC